MGLLRKKRKQPIRQLQSKNPTGLPTQNEVEVETGVNSSMIAAQLAAAHTVNRASNSSNPPPKPTYKPVNKPTTAQSKPKPKSHEPNPIAIPSSLSPKHRPLISESPQSVQNGSPVGLNRELSQLSVSDYPQPPFMRAPRSSASSREAGSILSLQAANAASKMSSQDFLQPPISMNNPSFYSSSASSAISSIHSFESLPLYAKLGYSEDKSSDSFDHMYESFESLRKSYTNDARLAEAVPGIATNNSVSQNSLALPSNSSIISTDHYGFSDRESSQVSDFFSLQSDLTSKQVYPSNERDSEGIPNTIIEHYEEEEEDGDKKEDPFPGASGETSSPYMDNNSSQRRLSTVFPARKRPPQSPSMTATSPAFPAADDYLLDSPSQYDLRPSSPKRKPPPGALIDSDRNYSTYEDTEDEVSQYPPSLQNPYPMFSRSLSTGQINDGRSYRHHKHFRIKSNAKKLLQKGLKTASTSRKPDPNLEQKSVQLKSTLRKEKKKEKFNEEKPWKHHNDTQFISESERKRYEGVWVSNKGLYMDLVDPNALAQGEEVHEMSTALKASRFSTQNYLQEVENNLILNIVVRELWSRSRLPSDQLRQVWELVDGRKDGTLDKKSFIVGMWYVDQCLYGRKLPKNVDENVWNSVSNVGLNVVIKPKRKK